MNEPRREGEAGRFGWLRRVDDAVFGAEQSVVASLLIAITVMVFLDVVYRRLSSPDSKVGRVLVKVSGITDPELKALFETQVGPWVAVVGGALLLWFGFWTAERHADRKLLNVPQSALVMTVLTAAAGALCAWAIVAVPSAYVYLLLYSIGTIAWLTYLLRHKPRGYRQRTAALLIVTPGFIYFALRWLPEGYTWSKELSLMLLLWVGFLGASICAHEGKHLRMEAFDRLLPPMAARWLRALGFLGAAAFSAFLALLGYLYVFHPEFGAYARGGVFELTQIPDWVATVILPIAFGLTALRFIGAAVSSVLGGDYGKPARDKSLDEAESLRARESVPAESSP